MKRRAIKRIAVLMALVILVCFVATGCTEADQVSANISQEADTGSGSYGRLAGMKGETAEGFFSQPGEKFWADAEYAADCHCCGALSKV